MVEYTQCFFLQDESAKENAGEKTKKKQESLARWYRNNLTTIIHRNAIYPK